MGVVNKVAVKSGQNEAKPVEENVVFYGNVGINAPSPDQALTVIGNVKISGNILQPSDVRIKENIEPVCLISQM